MSEAWVILHIGGDGELPAGRYARHEQRLQASPSRVDRRGVARGTSADDENLRVMDSHDVKSGAVRSVLNVAYAAHSSV